MLVTELGLPGLRLLEPRVFSDARGTFSETWNRRTMTSAGIDLDFVQDNQSASVRRGTIRGLHYQSPPRAQDKLVRCVQGKVWDVVVDVRRGSPCYGRWEGVELGPETGKQLFVPAGFLHGYLTLEPDTVVLYKCSDFYDPATDGSVLWSSCGIQWPFEGKPVLSERDAAAPTFAEFDSPFAWERAA